MFLVVLVFLMCIFTYMKPASVCVKCVHHYYKIIIMINIIVVLVVTPLYGIYTSGIYVCVLCVKKQVYCSVCSCHPPIVVYSPYRWYAQSEGKNIFIHTPSLKLSSARQR